MSHRGNARRRPTQKPSRPRTATEQVSDALAEAQTALAHLASAIERYEADEAHELDLGEVDGTVRYCLGDLATAGNEFTRASDAITQNRPLAGRLPSGTVWAGRQSPRYVALLLDRAHLDPAETVTYAERLADDQLTAAADARCPRHNCAGLRVRRANGLRASACWPHLPADEKAEVRAERDAAAEASACPSCKASAGSPCVDFNGEETVICTARLTGKKSAPTRN